MQVGGVGSGHDTYSHHVTSCLHEHGANTDTGSMGGWSEIRLLFYKSSIYAGYRLYSTMR